MRMEALIAIMHTWGHSRVGYKFMLKKVTCALFLQLEELGSVMLQPQACLWWSLVSQVACLLACSLSSYIPLPFYNLGLLVRHLWSQMFCVPPVVIHSSPYTLIWALHEGEMQVLQAMWIQKDPRPYHVTKTLTWNFRWLSKKVWSLDTCLLTLMEWDLWTLSARHLGQHQWQGWFMQFTNIDELETEQSVQGWGLESYWKLSHLNQSFFQFLVHYPIDDLRSHEWWGTIPVSPKISTLRACQ